MRYAPWLCAVCSLAVVILSTSLGRGTVASAEDGELAAAATLSVAVSLTEMSSVTGETFSFTSEITNDGSGASPQLVANLNIVSLDEDTYIDPEDWSPERTVIVPAIGAGSSATLTWTVNPILNGEVALFVVVLPNSPEAAAASPVAASPAISLHVSEHRSLNPGGVLPVVIAVPSVLAVAFLGLRVSRRRTH